ncbi:MAG: dockerin type I repeat-containing protein [Phycisphaerales bacterium]|nr:dockerin type I repeat-containing protein [Phycisphaerales bacterium]
MLRNLVGSRGRMIMALAAGVVPLLAGQALAQTRWDIGGWDGWANRFCTRVMVNSQVIPLDCGDTAQFLQKWWVPTFAGGGGGNCCSSFSITTGTKWNIGVESSFTICGAVQKIKGDFGGEWSLSTTYSDHIPCGCGQIIWEQDYLTYKTRRTWADCTGSWNEDAVVIKKIPNGGRWRPYYYAPATPCQGCTTANTLPGVPNAPAYNPNLVPSGFPLQTPGNLPQPPSRPWNPEVDGTPDFDGLLPPNGKDKQATFSVAESFKARKIESSMALTLYECRMIVLGISDLRAAPHLLGDQSWVRVEIAEGVSMQGGLSTLVSGIIKYADGMVNGKDYGDFNKDGVRDATDYSMLLDAIQTPLDMPEQRWYDLDGDGLVDQNDATKWAELCLP